MELELQGKIALVTGGAKGIGAGISESLAAEGVTVAVNYCSDDAAANHVVSALNARFQTGCFAVYADVTVGADLATGPGCFPFLATYQGQHCVEHNFALLKDPLVVNDLFLKTPARIEVLGMILILAVLVWRLMERSLRLRVENPGETLPGWRGRRTERPTAFMMSKLLVGVQTVKIKGKRYLIRPPGSKQMEYLKALGLTENVFLDPGLPCIPIIPAKKGV